MGAMTEAAAGDNLRAIAVLAHDRGDLAVEAYAYLLEAIALLKSTKPDAADKVQAAIARARKYQLEPEVRIAQMDILILVVDLVATMERRNPGPLGLKLRDLQSRMDEAVNDWQMQQTTIRLPIKKSSSVPPISDDTAAIIQLGREDETQDYLILSYVGRAEMATLV